MFSWLIIDGYNIINKWPALSGLKDKSIESAREKFNTLVQKYCDFKGIKITIVYDGKGPDRTETQGNPNIIFSKGAETADTVIEYLARNCKEPAQVTVATDDAIQRNFVKNVGARCISADELHDEMNETLAEMRKMLG